MKKAIRHLEEVLDSVLTATGYMGAGLLVLSAFFITYDVSMRWFFRNPTQWVFEYSIYMIAGAAYLSAAFVLREHGHIHVDLVVSRLYPRTKVILNFVTLFWSSVICAAITWSAFRMLLRTIALKSVSNTVLETPLWIPQSSLAVGFTLLSIQAIRMTIQQVTLIGQTKKESENVELRRRFDKIAYEPAFLLPILFFVLAMGIVMLASGGSLMVVGLIILLLTILATGTPVFLSMALTGGLTFFFIFGNGLQSQAQLAPFGHGRLMSPVLTAIPFFIVGAGILSEGGFSDKLFTFFQQWLPGVRGKLALVTVLACAMFAACTGSSPANAAAFSLVAIPAMLARNYDKRLAYGAVAGGGTLGPMIPPSIGPILFAEFTGLSVGALLIAGILPGILITAVFSIYIFFRCWGDNRYDSDILDRGTSLKERLQALWKAAPVFGIPIIVVGGIYSGFATPTESASLMLVYAIVIVFMTKGVNLKTFMHTLIPLIKTSTMIYSIAFAATILSASLVLLEAPQAATTAAANAPIPPIALIILMMFIILILGMFLDPIAIILIAIPILYPVVTDLGFNGIWFCVLFNLNMEIAMLTPPVGMNLYVLAGATKDRFEEIVIASIPFALCLLICMLILMVFPQIATWLPSTIR